MFDRRLMALCPESKRYIMGNILMQLCELLLNTVMIALIARIINGLYASAWEIGQLTLPLAVIAATVILRFFTARAATRMSYLASRTVKQKMRELIYNKLLKLGTG